jgi:hypothetical protein
MLPPLWKNEIEKTIEERANTDREQRETAQNDAAAKVAAAIKTLSDAQDAQTTSEDRNDKKNRAINITTLGLVFLTVIFTGLSWLAFRDQLRVFERTDKTLHETMVAADRAWIIPHLVKLTNVPVDGQKVDLFLTYGNTGREPASSVGYKSNSWSLSFETIIAADPIAPAGLRKALEAKLTDTCSAASENENLAVTYPTPLDGNGVPIMVDPKWVTQPIIDRGFIIAEGCFAYKTMGSPHKSRFCFFWNKIVDGFKPSEGRGYMSNCPAGNEAS